VRFSAAQSIVLFLPLTVIFGVLKVIIGIIAFVPLIGFFVAGFLWTAVFFVIIVPAVIIWLFLMIQAYRGVEVKLPYVGEYAEKLLRLVSPRQKKAGN